MRAGTDESSPKAGLEEMVARAHALTVPGRRALLGITGAPGAGKSTLAEALAERFGADCTVVPMDGFHLAGVELDRLGRRDRKGAPDTFDAAGYAALLRRLREPGHVYAPRFRRDLEEPIAGAIPVPDDVPLVITEGNYLLADVAGFDAVRPLLDEVWFLDTDETRRHDRLIARHVAYGKDPKQARAWALGSDEHNARVILAGRSRADLLIPHLELIDASGRANEPPH